MGNEIRSKLVAITLRACSCDYNYLMVCKHPEYYGQKCITASCPILIGLSEDEFSPEQVFRPRSVGMKKQVKKENNIRKVPLLNYSSTITKRNWLLIFLNYVIDFFVLLIISPIVLLAAIFSGLKFIISHPLSDEAKQIIRTKKYLNDCKKFRS